VFAGLDISMHGLTNNDYEMRLDRLAVWPVPTLSRPSDEFESRRNRDSDQFTILKPRANPPIIMERGIIPILRLAQLWVPTANSPNATLESKTGGRRKRL
jgi:hypothetical protein